MADEDVAAERARLEALAWGGSAPASEAAAARLALQELARTSGRSAARTTGGRDRRGDPGPSSGPAAGRSSVPVSGPSGGAPTSAPSVVAAGARAPGAVPVLPPAPVTGIVGTTGPVGPDGDPTDDVTVSGGGEQRLQAGDRSWRTRAARFVPSARPRVWIALGVAAAVGVAFTAGTVVGTSREATPAAPSVTPTAGSVTLEELLDVPQTYADQLPGPVEAPVSLHSTRLIFTNRALDGTSFETPWSVWAGVGTDRSTICLIATANRIESTSACYPREDALHGSVSLSAQSMSGTLTLTLRGGGVQGTVTNEG